MKQHILIAQLNELSDEQKNNLGKLLTSKNIIWGTSKGINNNNKMYHFPLLSIGQMIELLIEDEYTKMWKIGEELINNAENICDTLWESVKEVLKGGE